MATTWYIAFEGAEASGKSTQAALLAEALGAVLTRETGGTEVGRRLRDILHDTAVVDLSVRAEALMTAADRAQHMDQVVAPALSSGRHVVSDRSVYSALAYQGYGRDQDLDEIRTLNDWALRSRWPDLVLLVDADPALLEERLRGRPLDRFEQAGDAFHQRVRDGYRAMADADVAHWVIIDGGASIESVATEVRRAVRDRLDV